MLLICVIVGGENLVWPYWTRILVGVVYREIYVPLHRYNLKYSRNPDSSSCWTRLRCNVHSYSGTCIVLHRMPFYYQTFWVWYTRRTFSVHVSDLWAFIHCTTTKTLQNGLQGVQNLRNNNSAKVNPLRPLFTNCFFMILMIIIELGEKIFNIYGAIFINID